MRSIFHHLSVSKQGVEGVRGNVLRHLSEVVCSRLAVIQHRLLLTAPFGDPYDSPVLR